MCEKPTIIKMEELRLLIGRKEIAAYLGCHKDTVSEWRKNRSLPTCVLPNGKLATSYFLIDAWLMARNEKLRRIEDEQTKSQCPGTAD